MSMKEIKPRPRISQAFVYDYIRCSKCKRPMQEDDRDTQNGVTTYWFVCRKCITEGTTVTTNKNGHIVFPVVITGNEGNVIKTITKDEVMR